MPQTNVSLSSVAKTYPLKEDTSKKISFFKGYAVDQYDSRAPLILFLKLFVVQSQGEPSSPRPGIAAVVSRISGKR